MAPFRVVPVNPPPFQILEPEYDTPAFGRVGLAYLAGYLRQPAALAAGDGGRTH